MQMRSFLTAAILAIATQAVPALAQGKYAGPRPDKADIVYLQHVDRLIETETGQAVQSEEKNRTIYRVAGASSPVRTPMAEPILLFKSEKVNPDKLTMYRMAVEGGQRTLVFPNKPGKDSPKPIYLIVTPLDRGLFKIEVNEFIDDGEYCLSPEGSNAVFCFSTY